MNDAIAGNDVSTISEKLLIVLLQSSGLFGNASSTNGRNIRDSCYICYSQCPTLKYKNAYFLSNLA